MFDTCWRDSVPRICGGFGIRHQRGEQILQSGLSALRRGGCKRIGAAMKAHVRARLIHLCAVVTSLAHIQRQTYDGKTVGFRSLSIV